DPHDADLAEPLHLPWQQREQDDVGERLVVGDHHVRQPRVGGRRAADLEAPARGEADHRDRDAAEEPAAEVVPAVDRPAEDAPDEDRREVQRRADGQDRPGPDRGEGVDQARAHGAEDTGAAPRGRPRPLSAARRGPYLACMTNDPFALLARLLDAPGPSGFERAPARIWREAATFADS